VPAGNNDYLYKLFRKIGLSDFGAETAQVLIQRPVEILLILLGAVILSRIGARVARRSVSRLVTRSNLRADGAARSSARAETLAGVAASLVRIAVWTIAVLLVIDKLGINPGPVLAGASIVGVAVGFGAQSLVKDFVSGFFILAEDQYGVGDAVTVLDVNGTVEEVDLRVTRVRGMDGTVWFIPNGEIRKVGNSAKDWSRAIVDVTIPADADVDAATAAIADEIAGLDQDLDWAEAVLEAPEVLGVESIGTDDITLRVTAKTKPTERARVARELRTRIGARLRREGIVPVREPAAAPAAPTPPVDDQDAD
jgi:small-conductance mechanosensitive channel